MIIFTVLSFSNVFGKTTTSELNKGHLSSNEESDGSVEAAIPNGILLF